MPIGENVDSFDRYLVRMEEMTQSVSLIQQCIEKMPSVPVKLMDNKITFPTRDMMKHSM